MYTLLILIFVLGYVAIVFEHNIHINKTASALLTGAVIWSCYALFSTDKHHIGEELSHHLAGTAEILFFLLGAMTIVELVDMHHGFDIITKRINSTNAGVLLIIISIITFFLSAILDNLTTTIVMITLLRKLVTDKNLRLTFVGIVIVAANAGGAWSPLGDVTTTMLWIGGQITPAAIIKNTFIPSLISMLVPLLWIYFQLKNKHIEEQKKSDTKLAYESKIMFAVGIGSLIFVPIFKTVTHLPPYLGILFGLAVVWMVSEILHKNKDEEEKRKYSVAYALSKIDTTSILFFLGILLAISALETAHILSDLATWLDKTVGNQNIIVMAIGLASAVIDNVPLVAASMGMYDLATYPTDHHIWEFMAYCAGTGGSILVIGSAAGVAAMGMEKINFMWYAKKFSLIIALGYFAGAAWYMIFS